MQPPNAHDVATVRRAISPIKGTDADYDPLLDLIGAARFVLIGEASHGTHEFYRHRAALTQLLIAQKGFTAVAVEADWPDAYRVNRYVRGNGADTTASEALGGFKRFPVWMWRNTVVRDFVEELRKRNAASAAGSPIGFYGLDLYSLYASIDAVIGYLDRVDRAAARRARERYACITNYGRDEQAYGFAASLGLTSICENEIVQQLVELRRRGSASLGGAPDSEGQFFVEQNARLVVDAAAYYRAMFAGGVESWNLRDRHMADTLGALADHLEKGGGSPAKIVVWEHNSHLGDARATQMGEDGELNVGQLVRERYSGDCANVGFTTYRGTVTAADDWGGIAKRKTVRRAIPGSCELLLHEAGQSANTPDFVLTLRGRPDLAPLHEPLLERAIGVIYLPQTERQSHYFYARLAEQFDAVIHVDDTRALEPLELTSEWHAGEVPETYPVAV